MKLIRTLLVLLITLGATHAQKVLKALPVESPPEERARYLAAIPLPPESKLAPRQTLPFYVEHVIASNKMWERFNKSNFQRQLAWSQAEVIPRIPSTSVLYYLFSGPDFVNALSMFPHCSTYIMCGLESVGRVAPPETLSDEQLDQGLDNLRKATGTILEFSFFITKDMKIDLEQTEIKGVLPILYTFLALTGCEILDVQFLTLSSNGTMTNDGDGSAVVQIKFSRGAALPTQTLYYIRANLADDGGSPGLFTWMQNQPQGAAYLKAASYLMHETYFSKVRNFLLTHCTSILQDDSGIPFRYFDPNFWQITLFGGYHQPIALFQTKFQPDYKQAFDSLAAPVLPFGTGYNWKPGESNLMLAVRRSAAPLPTPVQPVGPDDPPAAIPVATPLPLEMPAVGN